MHGGGLELALVFLLAAVIAVPLFKRFGLGAVLGYLVAGVVLGPYRLAAGARSRAACSRAAELGVVMLLFVIGLELSPSRLWVMRRRCSAPAALQVLLSALVLGALAMLGGTGLEGGAGRRPRPGAVVHCGRPAAAGRAQGADQRLRPARRSRSCCSRTWWRFRCWR